jgi:hypothetical protein
MASFGTPSRGRQPNFYFHLTVYDILLHCGVEIGKRDFLGAIPMRIT